MFKEIFTNYLFLEMPLDKQLSKKRRFILACSFIGLLVYFFVNYITISPSIYFKHLLTSLLFISPTISSNDSIKESFFSMNNTPNEGFVTFSNSDPKYLALLTNLLDSVHYFSTRPIIAYGIDVDLNLNMTKYPRLIQRRLNEKDCGPSIFFCKIHAIIESKLDYGVHLEADSVVNWNVDLLFDVVHQWPYPYPLAPRHPTDPVDYKQYLTRFGLDLNNRTMPYIHAQFSWNYRAYPFFQQALDNMRQGYFSGANYDETGVNILLWKIKANHTLCKIDPFFTYLSAYKSKEKICKEFCHTAFILIHGSKSAGELRDVFERLKKHAGSPFIQTRDQGLHYLNETQYTCCYPDSEPSPIHPLLCQYPTKRAS
jgi:hypothetical protein